jgi:predicted  nucleic acid-binding Zn-ribbon protein
VPDDPQPPRRRTSDRNYSSLERQIDLANKRIDDTNARVGDLGETDDDTRRRLSELRKDLTDMRADMKDEARVNAEFRREVRNSFARNFREHESVQTTANDIKRNVEPTRWSKAKDFATFISVLIVPFLLTYLTIVLAGGAR